MMTTKQIINKIKKAENIAIFSHKGPDPDAFGSMFGLYDFCRKIGKNADLFLDLNAKNESFSSIFPFEITKSDFDEKNYDLVVLVDAHSIDRTEKCFQEKLSMVKNLLIIDHHRIGDDEEFSQKYYQIKLKASASQLILDLFKVEGVKLSSEASTYIYTGLIGDTNRFINTNTTKEEFEDAILLLESGAQVQKVYDVLYRSTSKEHIAVSNYLYSHLNYVCESRCAYVIFSKKTIKKLGVSIDDIKEFSNALTKIKGVELSFLIYEPEKRHFKFSMRSVPPHNLVSFANKMGGGGHPNASAFEKEISMRKLKQELPKWAKEILNA